MGDGALRGFAPSTLIVAERRGLVWKGALCIVGLEAELGGGLGGDLPCAPVSNWGFTNAELLRESLRKRFVPRSTWASGMMVDGGAWENRLENVALARRA